MGSKKSFKDLITETTIDDIEEINATKYINLLKDKIVINQFPLKIKIIITSEFTTPMAFDRIESHYSHPVEVVLTQNNLSTFYNNLLDKFKAWVDKFQERGSGFVFDGIKSVKVKLYKYEYQRASSYIPLQFKSSNIINVQNKKDNKCFLWSILASLFPANKDKQRVTKYKEYENEINMKGIEYPVSIKDTPKKYIKPQYFSYVGDDAVEKYVEKVMKIYKEITYKIYLNEKKKPILNNHEEDEFQEATGCYICGEEFKESEKVREHNHLSGKYRGAACQSCNTKEGKATKLIPVFFHNGSNYDFHFLIEELMKYEDEYNKVKLLSKNSENYISIDYGSNYKKLRFLDSYRFMLKGLSDIAKSMDEFPILEKEFKEQRTKAKSDFEKDLWKLMNNSFYGKTLENIRGRSEIKLFTDREEVKKYIKKPNFKDSIIFNDNFVAIENNVTSVKFNKPIYLGQAILDYSKQLMYSFYYDVANELWEKNELVASDTDSMILSVKTKDIYKDMEEIIDELDTSGYPKDHPLYSEKNKKSNW
ncbi:Hypothetical predicted protein [Mytilus galloprovincialis]|uniref:DNA-directed DNA polymerase n=2 Tax=Mytilus galloprovincialis TaxID=29158 RepID=A0A8B6D6U9_MYTGA|nr:Hypothetical predicted protein [Mytilus galloprovincialis]